VNEAPSRVRHAHCSAHNKGATLLRYTLNGRQPMALILRRIRRGAYETATHAYGAECDTPARAVLSKIEQYVE